MSKQILLLGEFSTGKSAFINMLLGVSILPERVTSTDLPVVKIYSGKPAGIWLREPNQKNPQALDSWKDIPKDWSSFQHAEITIPNHPLLSKNLVVWDTPGINSTNVHHINHLENFLLSNPKYYDLIYFFIHGNITSTSIEFIKKHSWMRKQLTIILNIKEIRTESDCHLLKQESEKISNQFLSNLPVSLLYIGDVCEEFNEISEGKRKGLSDYEVIAQWEKNKVDIDELISKYRTIGQEKIALIEEIAKNLDDGANNYNSLDLETLLHLANNNDQEAGYYLALRYYEQKNFSEYIKYLIVSAECGNLRACVLLSNHYLSQNNYKEIIKWFSKSAELGDSEAQLFIGKLYLYGERNFSIDYQKAINWFNKAASTDSVEALFLLGNLYLEGSVIEQNYKKAYEYFSKAAAKDHIESINKLGILHFYGYGCEKDPAKSFNFFKQASAYNYQDSFHNLAYLYQKGLGTSKNYEMAFDYYLKAANNENSSSQLMIGLFYLDGIGVTKNATEGFKWINKAAKSGDGSALNALGVCFENGIGTQINLSRAYNLYQESSNNHNGDGQYNLGRFFQEGIIVTKQESYAWKLFESAAEDGSTNAQLLLGNAYEKGLFIQANKLKAILFFEQAAAKGNLQAKKSLKKLYK